MKETFFLTLVTVVVALSIALKVQRKVGEWVSAE